MINNLKPYSEYKSSGTSSLGVIPAHWKVRTLRTLASKRSERNQPDLPLLSVARERGVFVRSIESKDENHNFIPDDLSNYKVARRGDLVINKMKAWQGSMGIAPCDGIVSPAYYVYELSVADVTFAQRLFRSKNYVALFAAASDGVRVGQWDLSVPRMKEIPVLQPPADEQAAIVRFLDYANRKIDKFIRAKRKLISLLNEQKQAIIHRAVTGGINQDVPLKPSGVTWLGDIPEHWDLTPLKSVCTIQSGVTLGKTYGATQLEEYPYLRVANVQAGRLSLDVVKSIRIPPAEARRSFLKAGDVLMTEGGDPDKLGRGCVWNAEVQNCLHQNHIFAVRPIADRLRSQYLASLLGSIYAKVYFLLTSKQTTNLASTNKTTIGQFRVPLPPVEEQDTILQCLTGELTPISSAISRTEREIVLMQEYRTRLTADIVTGKLDVRGVELPDLEELDSSAKVKEPEPSDYDVEEEDLELEAEDAD